MPTILNATKTKVLLFGKQMEYVLISGRASLVCIDGHDIPYTKSAKNLSLNMDNNVRYTSHISNFLKKA